MSRKQPLTSEEFKSIYSKVPRLTVEVIIHSDKGVILTLRKLKTWYNTWHIPGGTVLYGETVHEAVKRIAREELEIKVDVIKLIDYIEYPTEAQERGFGWSIGLAFLCKPLEKLPAKNSDGEPIKYFTTLPEKIIIEQQAFLSRIFSNLH